MTWFKVDDGLHDHRKTRQAGLEAVGLWAVAGSWCAGNLTDGFIPASVLHRWTKTHRKLAPLAQRLIGAGLWDEDSENGERGYRFHDWKKYQPTRSEVEDMRTKRAASGRAGGLASARAKAEASAEASAEANLKQPSNDPATPSRPVPSRSGLGSQSVLDRTGDNSDGLNLDRIQTALHSDQHRAQLVAAQVLAKAPRPPDNPTGYVVNAILREPHLYRQTTGPPALLDLCDEHGRDRATCPPGWHEATP